MSYMTKTNTASCTFTALETSKESESEAAAGEGNEATELCLTP